MTKKLGVCAAISAYLRRMWEKLKTIFTKSPKKSLVLIKIKPKGIIIHCTATPAYMDIGFKELDQWHKDKGWKGCGYHKIIRRDSSIEDGRSVNPFHLGAHCTGKNNFIGIVWVGGKTPDDFITEDQRLMMARLCVGYMKEFGFNISQIRGHNDFANKACPQLDMNQFKRLVAGLYSSVN